MNRSAIDLWVGVFVAIGLGALLFLALKVGNLASFSTAETYRVDARFSNIGGLKVRAPVKSAKSSGERPTTRRGPLASAPSAAYSAPLSLACSNWA